MIQLLLYTWAISESFSSLMYPLVVRHMQSGTLDSLVKKKALEDYYPTINALLNAAEAFPNAHAEEIIFSNDPNTGLPTVKSGNKRIALIPIVGPLSKYGDLCSLGMQGYQALLNKVNSTPSLDGAVIIMDTPGGTVDGTPEFGLAIKNSPKPVGVFGDRMVASAGLWLASQASVIVGNKNNPTQFGSIGVLMMLPNFQNQIAAGNHPSVEIFRASQSTDKLLVNSIEEITKEGRTELQDNLNSTAANFIATVKAGRGDKLDTKAEGLFTGRMFDLYQAKQIGLIDAIGTLQTAINRVADLARQQTRQAKTDGMSNADNNMKLPRISALFGQSEKEATSVAKTEDQESLTNDQASMEAAEKKLAGMEAEIAQLKVVKETADQSASQFAAQITELTAQVSTLTAEKNTLTATVAEQKKALDEKPTGTLTTVISSESNEANPSADQGATKKEESKFRSQADVEADAYVKALYTTPVK